MPQGNSEWSNVVEVSVPYTIHYDTSDDSVMRLTTDEAQIMSRDAYQGSERMVESEISVEYQYNYTFNDWRAFYDKEEKSLEEIRDEADWEV
jgi:hypothetical protein